MVNTKLLIFHMVVFVVFSIIYSILLLSSTKTTLSEYKHRHITAKEQLKKWNNNDNFPKPIIPVSMIETSWAGPHDRQIYDQYINDKDYSYIQIIKDGLYYGAMVHTTVGFGDIYPRTFWTRTVTSLHAFL